MTTEETVIAALYAVWRGVDFEYKKQYRTKIWRMFNSALRAAAKTSGKDTKKFISKLMRKMQSIPDKDLAHIKALIALDAREVLRMVRQESEYLVVMVRLMNEEQKEKEK